ncbi:MAG: hypothetical protein ACI4U5_03175 [Bacilli bacterium]
MTQKEIKESQRRRDVLKIAYNIYKLDGEGRINPEIQKIMDRYINLEIDYEEYRRQMLGRVGIKAKPLSEKNK